MDKEPKKKPTGNNESLEPLTTAETILDEMTKKFVIKNRPLRVTSRHGVKYDWIKTPSTFKTAFELAKFVIDFITHELPETQKQYTFKTIDKVWEGILDMIDTNNGHTTNGFKERIVKKPQDYINFERKRESLTVEEATDEILKRYDVDLAIDGSFLVISNRKNNEAELPIGGLGPVFRISGIIENELGYCQPECELTIGVVHNLFTIAGKKDAKPYILPEYIANVANKSEHEEYGK